MKPAQPRIAPEQRARLAQKGRLLYHKACGDGRTSCAESFALHHMRRGEPEVALDLIAFLTAEAEALRAHDPTERLAMTEDLAARIRQDLNSEAS